MQINHYLYQNVLHPYIIINIKQLSKGNKNKMIDNTPYEVNDIQFTDKCYHDNFVFEGVVVVFFLLLCFKISQTLSHIFDVHMYYLVPPLTEHCNMGRNWNYIIVYISVLLNTLSFIDLIYFNATIFCNDKINILSNHMFFFLLNHIL